MTEARWERVKELLHQAMQLPLEQRGEFLDRACGSEQALRAELDSLLAVEVNAAFLQSPPQGIGAGGALVDGEVFAERFQLIRKLGEGGMGQVWLADQLSPVRRPVALKLIKAGMYDEVVVQRFQAERQSLAMMDHPTIAKVFDAGTTPQGQPYFVMEYVPGLPITDYCDQHKFSISQRLALFIQVCEGVQHAHQKAIIHRDIKPANILVIEVDGKPTPRIIDFGLSKMITPQGEDQTLVTRLGHFLGTPGYMSPEQINPDVQDIDTRTDVYSLGVVLYVLLTGLAPFETGQRPKQPLEELLQKLRTEEPPFPSTKVRTDRNTSTASADARGTQPGQLISLLRGDLDWIAMKALERDRGRRYGTPSELAADLRRHLNHEPVMARPASSGYRLRMYVRRHRLAVGVGAGLMVLLAAFSVLQGLELRRTTLERDRANRERDRATRITDFMSGMFNVSDPGEARGNSVTAREILDKASTDVTTGLSKDPEIQSEMMRIMALTYTNLGLYGRAHDLAQRALNIRLSVLGADNAKTLESMTQLGWIMNQEGHFPEAEQLERKALAGERHVLGEEAPLTLESMDHLARIVGLQDRYDEEEKLSRAVVEIGTRRLGPENSQVLQAMANLGIALWNEARYVEAEQQFRQVITVGRRVLGPDHPLILASTGDLGLVLWRQGRMAEAEQLFRETLAESQRVLGTEHPNIALEMDHLANLLSAEGRLAEAEKLTREELTIRAKTLGPEHPRTLISKINLSEEIFKEGYIQEAERLQREVIEAQVRILGADNLDTFVFKTYLARTLIREGRYVEAEELARAAYEVQRRSLGALYPDTIDSLHQLGNALARTHRYPEATKLFHEVIEKQSEPSAISNRWPVWYAFACVAETANHSEEALQYLHEAINRGYTDGDGLMTDEDLKDLRPNPQFQQLVASLKRAAASR
jgi:eukaryotic-like serine/threonine-protein kinase